MRKSRRRAFALSIGLGLSICVLASPTMGQYNGGDLPASPWSTRAEPKQASNNDSGGQVSSGRLRPPGSSNRSEKPIEMRSVDRQINESTRPAPVTLLGPMLPHAATASPKQALTQKKPIEAQSDWQRLQAGGQILDEEVSSLANGSELALVPSRDRTASRVNRRIGLGLPDRTTEEPPPSLPSQTVSATIAAVRDEPMRLQAANDSPANDEREMVESAATAELGIHKASEPVNDEFQMKRLALAQRVSHELLSTQSAPNARAKAPEALESLPGWQSVERELRQRLERCDSLLKRGVVLSAREEVSQGLLRLYRNMDMHRGSLFSEPAFEKAMVAFREEADFQRAVVSRSGVQAIVDTHSTEALKGRPLENTSPEMAASHYRWYARYQLIAASDSHPWSADLLYAFGRTLEKDSELNPTRSNILKNQAVVCYQAAMQIAPSQSDISNQLGFALIHLDRMDDAYNALSASLQQKPTANAWNNLAELFRQRGANADAEYALQQAAALNNGSPKYSAENPEITEVDPTIFAKYSPMPTMASSTQIATSNNLPTSVPNAYTANAYGSNVRQANSGKNLFSKIFR